MKCHNFIYLGVLLASLSTRAQSENPVAQRELELARSLFQAGEYQQVIQKTESLLLDQALNNAEKLETNKLGGLSCYNLQRESEAEAFFLRMLKINPDYVLDPFAVPPATIRFFDRVRAKHAKTLDEVRSQVRIVAPPQSPTFQLGD